MSFNKNKDDIAITIPAFRMRKGSDFGKNEIGIVTMALDESGVANPSPALHTNSFIIPSVRKWTWVKFGGFGRIVYGPKNPGSFVYYSILFVESDQDVREFGATVGKIFESDEAKEIVKTLTIPNPTALLISTVVMELGKLTGKLLSGNKNDLIYSTEGSFFRDINPPYNIGDEFNTQGDHIECQLKVVPLVKEVDNLHSPMRAGSVAGSDNPPLDIQTEGSSLIELEQLAGVPKIIYPLSS